MRTSPVVSFVLGTILLVGWSTAPSSTSASPVYAPLVAGNTDFAVKLMGQLAPTNNANIFFSPYSISACLGMVYAGAGGETARQMAGALDFNTNQAVVGPEFSALDAELATQQGQNGLSLSVANGLWMQTNYPFLPAFLDSVSTNYDAALQEVNFASDPAQITSEINDWVANKTDGKIANLLPPGILHAFTRLVLVNAIYFKGSWQSDFDTNLTRPEPFYVSPGQSVSAPTMEQVEPVRYYEDSLLQAVELPYLNSNLTMVVLLPKSSGPVALTSAELATALNGLAPQNVDVKLPKFSLATTFDLAPILENLGMVDAFVAGLADFSGIDGQRDLLINNAIHMAVVDVNEVGTVAAGSTVVTIGPSVVMMPFVFQANHPFIFLIRDTDSASILFMGEVSNPVPGSTPGPTPPRPLILTSASSFGIRNHQFGFTVTSTNATLVVEACTNLASGVWAPIQTLSLTNGSAWFAEPLATNCPSRFYRVQLP